MKSETGGVEVLMGHEEDTADAAETQPARPGKMLVLPSEAAVEQHELTHLPFRNWCRHKVPAKDKESPHQESSPGGVSKFATDNMFMGDDGTPITILAGYDGLTKAFFADVVPCRSTSHGYRRKSTRAQRVVHKSSENDTAERPRTEHRRRQTQKPALTSQPKSCTKKAQLETVTPTAAFSERTKPSKDRSAQSRTTPNDRSVRKMVLTAVKKWLDDLRHGF